MRNAFLLLLPLMISCPILAQKPTLEITPYAGYRVGGEIQSQDSSLFERDAEIDKSVAFGVIVDIPLTHSLQLEFLAARQSSELVESRGLFSGDARILDVDLDYYHVGLLWQWGAGQLHPFIVTTLGIGRLDVDAPSTSSKENFSMSFGGGIKIMISNQVGFRVEHRWFWTDIDSGNYSSSSDGNHSNCWEDGEWQGDCWDYDFDYVDDLLQSEVSVGLVFSF